MWLKYCQFFDKFWVVVWKVITCIGTALFVCDII